MSARTVAAGVLFAALVGCGGAGVSGVARVSDAERMRGTLAGKDAETLAPQAFAIADQELRLAREAAGGGDRLGAELHAERAVAAYQRAVALARVARATQDEAKAKEALARANELAARFSAQREAIEREGDELEGQLKIAREAQLPAPAAAASPDRERARVVAAQALATQARLLCSAARLVAPDAPGLEAAERAVADLEAKLAGGAPKGPAPIDAAARARAGCLGSLTKARRAAGGADADRTDTLLAALSGGAAELAPSRDERGVVVTLRAPFRGEGLAGPAEATVKDLGRVAAAHPSFGVQVVLHDAEAPSAAQKATNDRRAQAVSRALVEGGAAAGKVRVEQAGARAPMVDPKDARRRDQNARLEIVFVAPAS